MGEPITTRIHIPPVVLAVTTLTISLHRPDSVTRTNGPNVDVVDEKVVEASTRRPGE